MAPETPFVSSGMLTLPRFNEAGATMAPETLVRQVMWWRQTPASMRPGQQWPRKLHGLPTASCPHKHSFNEAGATMAPETHYTSSQIN